MNIDKIKELVRLFHRVDYKDLFGALIINETIDIMDLDDIEQGDIDYLKELYNYYMESDINLFNTEELQESYEMER